MRETGAIEVRYATNATNETKRSNKAKGPGMCKADETNDFDEMKSVNLDI